jgi:hypothetical protein
MATKHAGLRLQPSPTDAQRIARLQAIHLRLVMAAERLVGKARPAGDRVYAVDSSDVLGLRAQIRESRRLLPAKKSQN